MIVVDASVVVEILLQSPLGRAAARELLRDDVELHAPGLIDAEVAQALRRATLRGAIREATARALLEDFLELPLIRHSHTHLLRRAWDLRHNLTMYDALYLALAEGLASELVTRDQRLANAPQSGAAVRVL